MSHVLDRTRLPEALQSVDWKLMSEFDGWLWEDCCRLLVAVPVVRDGDRWCYELSVVTRTLAASTWTVSRGVGRWMTLNGLWSSVVLPRYRMKRKTDHANKPS